MVVVVATPAAIIFVAAAEVTVVGDIAVAVAVIVVV